jgi:hypothetical protein
MSEQVLKQILKEVEDLETNINFIQSCPPASQTMSASIKYIINTHEPFIEINKSNKWDNKWDNKWYNNWYNNWYNYSKIHT